jgi:serine/threonine-protein kinase
VLSAQTRDLLADLGYPEAPVDTAAGFRYRYVDWRDPGVTNTDRPWSRLAELRPASIYFWYREQPTPMSGFEAGRIGLEQLSLRVFGVSGVDAAEPPFEPGSIYVERTPHGALDTLYVRPADAPNAGEATAPFDWSRLFAEAQLDMATFTAAIPDPVLALPGDHRVAWERPSVDPQLSLRVEAAALAGRPVAFRVLSPRTIPELGASPRSLENRGASYAGLIAATVMLGSAYLAMFYFMRRNAQLGRGDRRGAARLARVVAGLTFVSSLLMAGAPIDLRSVAILHGAAAMGLLAGALCWAFYMAIEPFVRRQWPRMLVGWSRLMAGEWRDPQVGREIFSGALTAAGCTALMTVINRFLIVAPEPPLVEQLYVRTLSSTRELLAGLLQLPSWTLIVMLLWTLLLLGLRRLLRSDVAAVGILAVVSVTTVPVHEWAAVAGFLMINIAALVIALRVGFLALVVATLGSSLMSALPFAPTSPGFVGSLSWIPVIAFVVPALFALYTALAGQSIFGTEREG